MVAKIVNGKNIRGVLNYNEHKIETAEAALLMAAGFPRDPDQLSFKNKIDRFEMLTRQNEKTKTNAMHIMLNFSRTDKLDNELLQTIATDYMNRIGFGQQPYLVYRHFDAAHPHIHIATVNIAEGGSRIETHNIGRIQSEKARKEIENWYGLVKAEEQQKETNYIPRAVPLEKARYGKRETKAAISAIVREVVDSYKFTSFPEYNAILRQFNIRAYRGEEGTPMHEKGGMIYQILDEHGLPVGIPIKASSIFGSPTLKNIEKRYGPNETTRKPYGQRLKHLLDKAISSGGSLAELEDRLQQYGIRIILRENVQGNVYGVSFIDNATRVIFNGSDLGKPYAAKAFMERLNAMGAGNQGTGRDRDQEQNINNRADANKKPEAISINSNPAGGEPVIVRIADVILAASYEDINLDPYRKKKKKRLQAE